MSTTTRKITEADGRKARYTGKSGKTATYRVLYAGPTKYGERAKLGAMDGSFDFWADVSEIDLLPEGTTPSPAGHHPSGRERCAECYDRYATTTATDSSGLSGPVCNRCARQPSYMLSFA